jgi:hypothetical protein
VTPGWDELRNQLHRAIADVGSLAAVERAAGLPPRSLKYFARGSRKDRPGGPPPTLEPHTEHTLRAYLQEKRGWPSPPPSAGELLDLLWQSAGPPPFLAERERFASALAAAGYYEELSWRCITARVEPDLIRIYEPDGGLEPDDYVAFAPGLYEGINRAELCEVIVVNLLMKSGVEFDRARRAARELDLGDRDIFDDDLVRLDFEALLSEARKYLGSR